MIEKSGMFEPGVSTRVLLTAFCGTSAETLIQGTNCYTNLYLPNDRQRDSEKLIHSLSQKTFDHVISFGQKPNVKNKVYIETTAHEGGNHIFTNADYKKMKDCFTKNGLVSIISNNAGTSFCNCLYLNGLKYIFQNNMNTKMIFVHIPFMKNISDYTSFKNMIFSSLAEFTNFRIDKYVVDKENRLQSS